MERVLELKDFNVTYVNKYKKVYAVKNANLQIQKGDSLGIVGESGSGKSTLAMALLRLLPEKSTEISGTANFIGKDITKLSKTELQKMRWKELAVVFQKSMNSLSPVHRIGTQIEDIYRVHHPDASREEIFKRIEYLLQLVNLSGRVYNLYPHELSGGMLQRVSIAISLMHNPKLLILDEATTALDVVTQGQILDEILKMEKELDMTRIMITHDMSVVSTSCNKVAIMYAGEFMEIGYVKDVLKNPKHPYTKGLLSSFPSLKGEKSKLEAIDGFLPDLSKLYDGCIFAPRCQSAMDKCFKAKPRKLETDEGFLLNCHLYGGEN
ncbi:ABC transporter ATP-binding protein [Lutispora saccharofermentans]|uniref:ABC transporter ATP-binding protein n=1 Tax=Lutispora saccharofermentans TaxID=3024236 RepID=A0ABT1NHB8_9FIRM|nr:ABC transporter ATP-binding protein [Lutispora saccharofermentans]MCQ1530650.1 ABC transporter ATP-binding protein [Lutispora saccharofermentans]